MLSVPAGDNAVHYYREVLRIDPRNSRARTGLDEVANRYASLAQRELSRNRANKASHYVRRGLSIRANNRELLTLRRQLAQRQSIPADTWRHPTVRDHSDVNRQVNQKKKPEVYDPLAGISE